LQTPIKNRVPSGLRQRFTLALESNAAVADAHRWLSDNATSFEIAAPSPLCLDSERASFIFTDPDANCWEIIAASS
jgi:hypothetical protein